MRSLWMPILLSAVLLECHAAPTTPPKDKPSVMIGIKRSSLSTSTPQAASVEPESVSTQKSDKPQIPHYTKKPNLAEKEPIKTEKPQIPHYTKKPTNPEKTITAEKEKPVPTAKKPVDTEKRSEISDEPSTLSEAAPEKPAMTLTDDSTAGHDPTPSTEATPEKPSTVPPQKENAVTDVYDNSQHGDDNYRIHVKGFTILVAPQETVLGAAMIMSGLGEMKDPSTPPGLRSHEAKGLSSLIQFLKKMKNSERR